MARVHKRAKPKGKAGKATKARIAKLNEEVVLEDIHKLLRAKKKTVQVLDVATLKEDLKRDELARAGNEQAARDLAAQVETITGMTL